LQGFSGLRLSGFRFDRYEGSLPRITYKAGFHPLKKWQAIMPSMLSRYALGQKTALIGNRGPYCSSCGKPMRFCKAVPRLASLPELRTYDCKTMRGDSDGS
jgi:hypothetical protein